MLFVGRLQRSYNGGLGKAGIPIPIGHQEETIGVRETCRISVRLY
jgi:hypothetical protein